MLFTPQAPRERPVKSCTQGCLLHKAFWEGQCSWQPAGAQLSSGRPRCGCCPRALCDFPHHLHADIVETLGFLKLGQCGKEVLLSISAGRSE